MVEPITLPTKEELNSIWRSLHPDLPDFNFEWSASRSSSAGSIYYRLMLVRLSVKHYLEFGINQIIDTLKHEAAHWLAWKKHGSRGHNQYFYYYLGMLGATRHCLPVSADMKARRVRLIGQHITHGIEYDPITKTFRQRR